MCSCDSSALKALTTSLVLLLICFYEITLTNADQRQYQPLRHYPLQKVFNNAYAKTGAYAVRQSEPPTPPQQTQVLTPSDIEKYNEYQRQIQQWQIAVVVPPGGGPTPPGGVPVQGGQSPPPAPPGNVWIQVPAGGTYYPGGPGSPPSGAYPNAPPSGSYPSQPPSGSYPSQPPAGSFPSPPPSGSYPSQPPAGSFPSPPPSGSYPSQPPAGSFPSPPPSGSYPSQPPAGSFPSPPTDSSFPPNPAIPPPDNSFPPPDNSFPPPDNSFPPPDNSLPQPSPPESVPSPVSEQPYPEPPSNGLPPPPSNELPTTDVGSPTPDPELKKYCKAPRGQFPGPSCRKFINCWDDIAIEQECPAELYFNPEGFCDYPFNVDCKDGEPPKEGAPGSGGTGGAPPPPGTETGPGAPPPGGVPAGEGVDVASGTCTSAYGTYRSKTNCGQFYVCSGGTAYEFICPAGLNFHEDLKVCDYPYRVECNGVPTNPIPPETEESQGGEGGSPTPEEPVPPQTTGTPAAPPPPPPPPPPSTTAAENPSYYGLKNFYNNNQALTMGRYHCLGKNNYIYRLSPTCNSVAVCQNGYPQVIRCASGQSFDTRTRQCLSVYHARC
ncbi:uncharacterized protein LOC142327730 [Lycorma delicatula]|uniref:uncharacterized protein LOC142327730 n=1 Tax=Lycorma delicatula TaxID=130591 RepID=UPI003F50E43F